MQRFRCTLLAEGTSDRALLPILRWLLVERYRIKLPIDAQLADLRHLPRAPEERGLIWRLRKALHIYPCELLFVHRDADRELPEARKREIQQALDRLEPTVRRPAVCVIPVRMQEAWLLFDKQAIRTAAGNPNGKQPLEIPQLSRIESIPQPKKILHDLLKTASGLPPRRLRKFPTFSRAQQVANHIEDFTPLLQLIGFQLLIADLGEILVSNGWIES